MPERTFGWVQDPGDIGKLRRVVEIFDPRTATYQELVAERIPRLVPDPADCRRLLDALATDPLEIGYVNLKGRALGGPRAQDPCNGIVQAVLPGQRRPYLSEWAADNFLRWAHALGFLAYQPTRDTFALAEAGRRYLETPTDPAGINAVFEDALLAYPPAVRILRLLSQDGHLTKFELGRRLGFVGENGFTTLPQDLLVRELALEPDPRKRAEMQNTWDGTSDKYARMIAGWLASVGWVIQEAKPLRVRLAGRDHTGTIAQAYLVTAQGLAALRRAEGRSRHARLPRNVPFEMLATKASARTYLRLRRARIIEAIQGRGFQSPAQIRARVEADGLPAGEAAIIDDLLGLEGLGLQIERDLWGAVRLADMVQGLAVPRFTVAETRLDDIQRLKEEIRPRLGHLPHERLVLIDLSFDRTQSRLFEAQTVDLLLACGFRGAHLGGADRPDGVVYTQGLGRDYGLILDTKAYRDGFACDADERRAMQNYVQENRDRPAGHPTAWWTLFPPELRAPDDFRFLFVASRFTGEYAEQFARLSGITAGTRGAGITAANLLLFAEAVLAGRRSLADGYSLFAGLSEARP